MTLTERIKRDSAEDKIYLGLLVEKATKGEYGDFFRLLCNGIIAEQVAMSSVDSKMPADRYLGRVEAVNMIQDRLIMMIDIKNSLVEEKRQDEKV